MDTSVVISLIGIIVGLALLMFLIMRGVNIFVIALTCSAIAALCGGLNVYDALKGNYMEGFVNFFRANFLIFLTGTLMGKVYEITNGAKSIAKLIVKVFGKKMSLISIPLACGIISYGGVSVFVASFAVFPIALEVFKEADYPRRFIPAALTFGCSTFAMVAPGAPQIQNAVPANALGTDLMAGAVNGFISCAVILVVGGIMLYKMVGKAQKNGEHFVAKETDQFHDDAKLPNGLLALVPLAATLFMINFKVNGEALVPLEAGVFLGSVLVVILLNNYQDNKQLLYNVGEACKSSVVSISNTCAVVGFGTVVQATIAFPVVVGAMTSLPGPELVGVAVGTTVIAGICGSASGGLGIAAPLLGPIYVERGISASIVHRVMSISSAALDSLPHNGYIVTVTNGLCKETHKDAYGPIFWVTVVAPAIGSVVAVILFTLFPNFV